MERASPFLAIDPPLHDTLSKARVISRIQTQAIVSFRLVNCCEAIMV